MTGRPNDFSKIIQNAQFASNKRISQADMKAIFSTSFPCEWKIDRRLNSIWEHNWEVDDATSGQSAIQKERERQKGIHRNLQEKTSSSKSTCLQSMSGVCKMSRKKKIRSKVRKNWNHFGREQKRQKKSKNFFPIKLFETVIELNLQLIKVFTLSKPFVHVNGDLILENVFLMLRPLWIDIFPKSFVWSCSPRATHSSSCRPKDLKNHFGSDRMWAQDFRHDSWMDWQCRFE